MYIVSSYHAENGRRRQRIGELMGRVLAHGVNPEPPKVEDFDIVRMMEGKKRFVEARGGGPPPPPKANNDTNPEVDLMENEHSENEEDE